MKAVDLFRRAHNRLEEAGLDGREAELILESAAGLSREALYRDNPDLTRDHRLLFDSFLTRRLGREPLAYIIGTVRFLDLELTVNPAVLVPRPETEWMVARIEDELRAEGIHPPRIIDIGTGSGCIALALARAFPRSFVLATDISREALSLARRNALANGLGDRVHFLEDSLLSSLDSSQPFDLIVSNPPYVAETDRSRLEPELAFEPPQALFAGTDGLEIYRELAGVLPRFLAPGGHVFLEIGSGQGSAVSALMATFLRKLTVWRDLGGKERVVAGRAVVL